MKHTPDEELEPLAEAVSDGTAVDWEGETSRNPHLTPMVRELKVLEALATVHRGPGTSPNDTPSRGLQPPSPASPLGQWGPLLLLEKIGKGGFGEVYRAFDPGLQRDVALKLVRSDRLIDDEVAERILKEGRRLARVRHAGVVVVHGIDRHAGTIGIWSDLVRGQTLETLLAQQGPFGAHEASRIGIEVVRALSAVHGAGLLHRDVKTTNVMREEGGRIVLMDFGAATEVADPSHAAYGTPLTTAPEVLRGESASPAADLYALGVLLYRLTSGHYPVEAKSIGELLAKHDSGARMPLRDRRPDLPADFVQVVETALDPDPRRRFASAGAMERALAGPVAVAEVTPRRGRFWLAGSASLAGLLAIVLMMVWSGVGRRAERQTALPVDPSQPGTSPRESVGSKSTPGSPAVTTPLVATARLHRDRRGEQITLAPGGRVAPGDGLFLELSSPERVYAYVLNEDEKGEAFMLFPAPGLDLANPLAARENHRLPGPRGGEPYDWQVTSVGGSETIVVVVSRTPVDVFERAIGGGLAVASPDRKTVSGPPDSSVTDPLRGIGGMRTSTRSGASSPGRVAELLARSSLTGSDEAWVWKIRLENQGN